MKRLIWATAVASLASLALLVAPSQADFNIGYYTHDTCENWSNISTRVDPINYVFFTWGTTGRVLNQVLYHGYAHGTNWNNHDGTGQKFIVHSSCYSQDDQQADHNALSGRTHFRYKGVDYDARLGWTSIADAHHENIVWCGAPKHAVDSGTGADSGFNMGRKNVTNEVFSGTTHYTNSYQNYFGNTQPMRQCDGKYAASDGYVRMMWIHQTNH